MSTEPSYFKALRKTIITLGLDEAICRTRQDTKVLSLPADRIKSARG